MARALIIGEQEEAAIKAAVARARKKPIPWDVLRQTASTNQDAALQRLEDRPPEHMRRMRPQSECVELPIGYRVCVSYEEQPAGLIAHFSVSVAKRDSLPNPFAVRAILAVAGFEASEAASTWIEEFMIDDKPGGVAVNLVFLVAPAQMGHA